MVAHMGLGHVVEINVAVDSAHAEHVLTFEIGTVAPAEHLDGDVVIARAKIFGDVKLGVVVGALGITHVFSVDPDEGCRVDAAEVEHRASVVPVGGKGEVAFVGTDRIYAVVGPPVVEAFAGIDEWRSVAVGIFHVGINRLVIALHLPV